MVLRWELTIAVQSRPPEIWLSERPLCGHSARGVQERSRQCFLRLRARLCPQRVRLGEPYLWRGDSAPRFNFPTKDHWRSLTLLDIEHGWNTLSGTGGNGD